MWCSAAGGEGCARVSSDPSFSPLLSSEERGALPAAPAAHFYERMLVVTMVSARSVLLAVLDKAPGHEPPEHLPVTVLGGPVLASCKRWSGLS